MCLVTNKTARERTGQTWYTIIIVIIETNTYRMKKKKDRGSEAHESGKC